MEPGRARSSSQRVAIQSQRERSAEWKESIPEKLDRFAVRDAVRTHLAWTYRYTLPADEQTKVEQSQVTVGDFRGTPAEVSTHYAMPGFAARHPEAFTRLPDDNAALRQQLAQLRSELETFGTRSSATTPPISPSMDSPPSRSTLKCAERRPARPSARRRHSSPSRRAES